MKYLVIFICLVFILIVFALCKIAGESDEKIERMLDENKTNEDKEDKVYEKK